VQGPQGGRGGTAPAASGALVEPREHELPVAECLGGVNLPLACETSFRAACRPPGPCSIPAGDAGDVDVDVLAHRAHGAWVRAQFDDGKDRVADDVALPGGKK